MGDSSPLGVRSGRDRLCLENGLRPGAHGGKNQGQPCLRAQDAQQAREPDFPCAYFPQYAWFGEEEEEEEGLEPAGQEAVAEEELSPDVGSGREFPAVGAEQEEAEGTLSKVTAHLPRLRLNHRKLCRRCFF